MTEEMLSVALSSKQSRCGLPVTLGGPRPTPEERSTANVSGETALNSPV